KYKDGFVVRRGGVIRLSIPIRGKPIPTCMWTKEGHDISRRAMIASSEDLTELVIKEAQRNDTGVYNLVLQNKCGKKFVSINVKVIGPPDPPQGPLQINDIQACSVRLTWKAPIDDGGSDIHSYIVERREIPNLAWYTVDSKFDIYSGQGLISYISCVLFTVVHKPSIIKEMEDATTKLGQPGTLKCQITGRPLPVIKWYRHGKELLQGKKYEMNSDGRNHSLTITSNQQDDEGVYTCKAINEAGETETSGSLIFEAAPMLSPEYPLKEIYHIVCGASLRLHVMYIGRPEPKITWLHNNVPLQPTENVIIENTKHYTHLIIKNAQRETNTGKYKVQLSNTFGTAEKLLHVEIQDKPGTPEGPIIVEALLKNSVIISWKPPADDGGAMITNYIVEKCEDTSSEEWNLVSSSVSGTSCRIPNLNEGAGYYFRVSAQNQYGVSDPLQIPSVKPGNPQNLVVSGVTKDSCIVSWIPPLNDGGSKIKNYCLEKCEKENEWISVTTDEIHQTVYTVNGLVENSEYKFRVKCDSLWGESDYIIDKFILLFSIVPAKIHLPKHIQNKESIPALRGEVISIKIPFSGKPDPVITWQKGQDLIDSNGNYQVIVTRSFTSLIFPNGVERKDAGFYVVCAKNRFGIDQQTVELYVADVPDPPRGLKVSDVSRDSVTLNWCAPANDGGSKVTNYIVEKCATTAERWIRVAQARDTHYTVVNLFGKTSYQFRVISENKFGQSEPSEPTDPVVTKEDKSRALSYDEEVDDTGERPPEFTLPLYNRAAYVGEDVRFAVTITVHPEPRVTWLKSGQKILPGDNDRKYTFINDKGLYQLIIHNVQTEDDGEYTVLARNKFGDDSCKALLSRVSMKLLGVLYCNGE
uniref:Uncharacterized protein n=1 Tax=Paramormyrops kingsleyae TaxID=1676925 RepID=A0A3B3Q9X2_9TELE